MRTIVLAKQVPDIEKNVKVNIDSYSQSIKREGVPSIMNPSDKNALEEALKIKDINGAEVIVVSMGPQQAVEILKEAISMGADECYLVSDRSFAGSDTLATSLVLSETIRKIGSFDFIFCGKQAIDGDTGQVGPGVAERFNVPQILNVKSIEIQQCGTVTLTRDFLGLEEKLSIKSSALISFNKNINTPRLPTLRGLFKAKEYTPKLVTNEQLILNTDKIGINGSPTKVIKTFKHTIDKSVTKINSDKGEEILELIISKIGEVK
jgi:electron transfer flavoprotein alpha/beta subunit